MNTCKRCQASYGGYNHHYCADCAEVMRAYKTWRPVHGGKEEGA